MGFAEKLAAIMNERGVSQSELFRQSGVPQKTISAYLAKVNKPSWQHVQSLAKALGVSCIDLTDDDLHTTTEPVHEAPPSKPKAMGKRK